MNNVERLTRREAEVALLLLQGKSNKEIAAALGVSVKTVEFHLENIYAKLQVGSRTEAMVILGKSIAILNQILGKSSVETGAESVHNQDSSLPVSQAALNSSQNGIARFFGKYKYVLGLGLVFALAALVWLYALPKPATWEKYSRECEYPDESTVGQMIRRLNASASRVHGQFGVAGSPPWPAQPGYVSYKNVSLPQLDQVYLQLRYSKDSPPSVPILVFIDNETAPRASLFPIDQHGWDQFAWTEPIYLGKISGGVHSFKFSTDGQQYGVADLDQFILTRHIP